MYRESEDSRKTLGDIDVVYQNGVYHLFHLVLPNHDYIAHAVSNDCIRWRRVENALFIGHPGAWDDLMLWTVHVSRHPSQPGRWRMFYTGLSRREQGSIQRIGLAESDDLFTWKKSPVNWTDRRSKLPYDLPARPPQPSFAYDQHSCFPLEAQSPHYESSLDQGRHWISWRDPFYFRDADTGYLFCAGRVADGPIVRRGCVATMEESKENCFRVAAPLHHPGMYDDIEVPNLLKINGRYYLIGSIREDAKVRYWYADKLGNSWCSPSDNVLIGSGNYAGRVTDDDSGFLFWSFFSRDAQRATQNLMPPPKRICANSAGGIELRTYEGFDKLIIAKVQFSKFCPLIKTEEQKECVANEEQITLRSNNHFQIFAIQEHLSCFRFQTQLRIGSTGKCGLCFRLDDETRDGYYLSLDLHKGVAQLRLWGTNRSVQGEKMMHFSTLQNGYWVVNRSEPTAISLIAHGSYIELSVDNRVILSLADQTFSAGALGVYLESASVELFNPTLEKLESPVQSDEHLAVG